MMHGQASVADTLERQKTSIISLWFDRVEAERDIIIVQLSFEERTAHLAQILYDLINRLRYPLPLGTHALQSDAAHDHGTLRCGQGYTHSMLVEESRMLQVSIFQTLQEHLGDLDISIVMLDVMAIADEVDSQPAQTMTSFTANLRSTPIKRKPKPGLLAGDMGTPPLPVHIV